MDIAVTEFRAQLRSVLERVRAGEEIVVTDRGIPVARVVAVNATERIRQLTEQGIIAAPQRSERPRLAGVHRPRPTRSVADIVVDQRG